MNHKITLQITSGRGPHECTWALAQVLREVQREANLIGIDCTICCQVEGLLPNTLTSALIEIVGKNIDDFANTWIGTIQWIGQSPYRKLHKRKNWFIAINKAEIPDAKDLYDVDVRYEVMRSSGAGGQHVNKVNSCVRATHVPSGLTALAMDTRSQHQNKQLAYERLKLKFMQNGYATINKALEELWLNQIQIERGNAIRTYEGSKFKRRT
jgi:peptide chain release factor